MSVARQEPANRRPGFPRLGLQEQVRRIVEYGRQRHVDVVPCMEFYGHLHDVFRLERYAHLAALPYGGEINPRLPEVRAILKELLAESLQK